MSVGFKAGKDEIDLRSGQAVVNLRESLEVIDRIKAWLDTKSVADLQALTYSETEANLLKNSFTDLSNLSKIARAQGTQAVANDFFFNAKQLAGLS